MGAVIERFHILGKIADNNDVLQMFINMSARADTLLQFS